MTKEEASQDDDRPTSATDAPQPEIAAALPDQGSDSPGGHTTSTATQGNTSEGTGMLVLAPTQTNEGNRGNAAHPNPRTGNSRDARLRRKMRKVGSTPTKGPRTPTEQQEAASKEEVSSRAASRKAAFRTATSRRALSRKTAIKEAASAEIADRKERQLGAVQFVGIGDDDDDDDDEYEYGDVNIPIDNPEWQRMAAVRLEAGTDADADTGVDIPDKYFIRGAETPGAVHIGGTRFDPDDDLTVAESVTDVHEGSGTQAPPNPSQPPTSPFHPHLWIHIENAQGARAGLSDAERERIQAETRQRFLMEGVEAQIVVTSGSPPAHQHENKAKGKRKHYIGLWLCFGLAVMVGVVMIALAATGQFQPSSATAQNDRVIENKGNGTATGDRSDGPGHDQQDTTTNTTTTSAPTTSVPTTLAPTTLAPTPVPSQIPTTTSQPTDIPTLSPTLGENLVCTSAHPLEVGPENAINASFPFDEVLLEHISRCETGSIREASGLWYRHRPSKSGPMVVQVTEGYTVRVFQSAFFTPDMDCVYMDCPKSPIHQFDIHRTSWLAEAGAHYIILVHTDYPIAIQTFEVSLWYNDVPMFPYGPIDVTGNAQVLPGTFSRGSSLSASSYDTPIATASTGAASHSTTNNHFIAMPSCGTATPQSTVGAWYTVHGNGEEAIALTCGLTSIDTQISVFVHDTPWEDQLDILHHQLSTGQLLDQDTLTSFIDSLQCVDGNDDSCSSTQSQVSWSTEVGKLYFVLVHGHVEDTNHTEPFEISFFDGSPQNVLDGDFCVNAIDANDAVFVVVENEYDPTKNIVPHEEVLFDNCYLTKFVSFDGVEDRDIGSLDGCYNEWTYPRDGSVPSGLWYRVDGTGGTFRVRMACIDDPGYGETGTSVLTHPKALGGLGCGQLECVTDTCNDECEFQTTEDNVYYIFIFTFPEVFCSSPTLHFHIIDSQ